MNRLLHCLCLPLIALLVIALAGCSGREARIQSHMEKAQSLLAQSEYDKAILEVRNVLQMDPKRAQAYYVGGQIEESRGELQKSFTSYSKALELKPDLLDAKTGQARLELAVGDIARAEKAVTEVLAVEPSNAPATVVEAGVRAQRGDIDGAIALVSGMGASTDLPPSASLRLAQLYASGKKDPVAAQKVVDAALRREPRNLPLLMLGATVAAQQNHSEATVSYFERAAAAAPKNLGVWHEWAVYYDRSGALEDAERVLRASIAAEPDDSARYLALVSFLNDRRGPAVAQTELLKLCESRPRDYRIQFALASHYRVYGSVDDAKTVLLKLVSEDPTGEAGLGARNDLAGLDLQAGRQKEARKRLDEILGIDPRNSTALLARARLELAANELDPAIADLRATAKDHPDSAPILGLLVSAYQANKQTDLARDTIADAAKLFPNRPELGLMLSEYYSRTGQADRAIATLDDMIRANPRYTRPYEIKAALLLAAKDSAGAEATLRNLQAEYPNDPLGPMHLGEFYENTQKFGLAVAQYDRAAALAPTSNGPRVAAFSALIKNHQMAEAENRINRALVANPNDALELGLLGDLKTATGDFNAADGAYRKAIELQPRSVPLYLRAADMFAKKKDFDGVIRVLDQGIAANPSDDKLLLAEASFYQHAGRIDDAIGRYDAVLQRNPADTLAANNLATLLTEAKGDRNSLNRALVLAQRFEYTGEPGLLDTLGWTRYKMGQTNDAVDLLKRAESLSKTPVIELHYGLALYKAGDLSNAKEHLRFATESKDPLPELDEARKIVAQG